MSMEPGHPRDLLERAERDVAEQARLTARRSRAQAAAAAERESLAVARRQLDDESADVERLESFSPTRIWAGLRGDRAERLDVERAEQDAAAYAVAVVEARVAAADREVAAVDAELAALGDVEGRRASALQEAEAWVRAHGGAASADLDAIARESAAVWAELREVDEAGAAANAAEESLKAAADHLGKADGWATYDTFFGGGFIADMAKRDRMDKATALMREADDSLRLLTRELGDLGVQGVGELQVDALTGVFDVLFDNIFTDWSVKNRIGKAADRVQEARAAVWRVAKDLGERRDALRQRGADLAEQRETLLRTA